MFPKAAGSKRVIQDNGSQRYIDSMSFSIRFRVIGFGNCFCSPMFEWTDAFVCCRVRIQDIIHSFASDSK